MNFNNLEIFLLVILTVINGVTLQCSVPEICRPITSCRTLNHNFTLLTEQDRDLYLRASPCEENEICCGSDDNVAEIPNVTSCGRYTPPRHIRGGRSADIYEYPWMAVLEFREQNSTTPIYDCAGSLINQRYVLTAAHCFSEKPGNRTQSELFQVHLGEYQLHNHPDCILDECTHPIVTVGFEEILVHPDFFIDVMANDIALVRLAKKVYYTEFIRPICLPSTLGIGTANENMILEISGWGSDGKNLLTHIKQKLVVHLFNHTKCGNKYSIFNRYISETQLCAGGSSGQGSCTKDSGSPLMALIPLANNPYIKKYAIEGITSFGLRHGYCGSKNWPVVYTRVSSFEEWIRKKIRP